MKRFMLALVAPAFMSSFVFAHAAPGTGIDAKKGNYKKAEFDIVRADVRKDKNFLEFTMKVSGKAGKSKPSKVGKLAGSDVFSYVWPTSIDSSAVGFDEKQGILALAVTSHPDFDDTPLFDENGDGKFDNDGDLWHAHWVVLVKDDVCGKDALKVRDILEGTKPKMPATWPGLPIYIDSPGYTPVLKKETVTVRVGMAGIENLKEISFDGVTAGLRVNASVHSPLLCVKDIFDIASGDLSLPGKAQQ